MSDFALGTGRASALSAPALPPEGVLPDSSSPAEVLSALLSPTPRPEGRSNEGRPQSSPSRSFQPNHAAFTTTSPRAGCGRGRTKIDTLGVAQSFPSRPTDPRLPREPSLTRAIGHTNGYNSFEAQPPQGTETVGAGPNVQAQPVCRDSGNRRSRTRVHSPLPHTMARKRRAISVKGGAYRTSARTPDHFTTVFDATIISSAPNNTNTNYHTNNAMQDLMNPHAAPAAANAAIAEPSARTGGLDKYSTRLPHPGQIQYPFGEFRKM
jgi:hypothetical protein